MSPIPRSARSADPGVDRRRRRPRHPALAALVVFGGLAACLVVLAMAAAHDDARRPDWAGLEGTPAGVDPSCTSGDPRTAACARPVAGTSIPGLAQGLGLRLAAAFSDGERRAA
jgi:hypothetical protein